MSFKTRAAIAVAGIAIGSSTYFVARLPSYPCRVEPNMTYPSRGGQSANVTAVKSTGPEPIRGVITENGVSRSAGWNPEGRFLPPYDKEDPRDIVCPKAN